MSPIKLIKIAAKTTEEVRLEKKAKFKKKAWLLKKHGRHIFFYIFPREICNSFLYRTLARPPEDRFSLVYRGYVTAFINMILV